MKNLSFKFLNQMKNLYLRIQVLITVNNKIHFDLIDAKKYTYEMFGIVFFIFAIFFMLRGRS